MTTETKPAPSKQQRAFFRKLYLSYLLTQQQHSAASLHKETGMPRRTIQDTLKDLGDIGIEIHFVQQEGGRHNSGYYEVVQWGPIDPSWIEKNLNEIKQVLTS